MGIIVPSPRHYENLIIYFIYVNGNPRRSELTGVVVALIVKAQLPQGLLYLRDEPEQDKRCKEEDPFWNLCDEPRVFNRRIKHEDE